MLGRWLVRHCPFFWISLSFWVWDNTPLCTLLHSGEEKNFEFSQMKYNQVVEKNNLSGHLPYVVNSALESLVIAGNLWFSVQIFCSSIVLRNKDKDKQRWSNWFFFLKILFSESQWWIVKWFLFSFKHWVKHKYVMHFFLWCLFSSKWSLTSYDHAHKHVEWA